MGADGIIYAFDTLDALYLGKGTRAVFFHTVNTAKPLDFFQMSAPVQHTYPNCSMARDEALPVRLSNVSTPNQRTTNYRFIWAMAGENYTFTDMDSAPIPELL